MIHPPNPKTPIDRIDELESHTQLISSLEWAQQQSQTTNPRLLTTSFDGTARIWNYSRQRWKAEFKIVEIFVKQIF